MELKLREDLVIGPVFLDRVVNTALELFTNVENYTITRVHMITMIAWINELVEDNVVLSTLGQSDDKAFEVITTEIEPFFLELSKDEVLYKSFLDCSSDVEMYLQREVENNRHFAPVLSLLINKIGELELDTVVSLLGAVKETYFTKPETTVSTIVSEELDEEIREDMKEFMSKYMKVPGGSGKEN